MNDSTISVQELQMLLNENKPVFILDVRPQPEREEWHIPGSFHKDAYEQLKLGNESVLDEVPIPENMPVVTLCAAGKTSKIAADILNKNGYAAYSLEGGMKAWNYAWNTAELMMADSNVKIIQLRRVAKGCLSYIVGSGNEAIVVDASLDPEVYLRIAKDQNWNLKYVMDTHIHADYLSRTRKLAADSGAKHIFIEEAEGNVEYPFIPVKDQQLLSFGSAALKILHTPGHTPESTSYLINGKALLTGDTLFTDGVGRPDLKADQQEAVRKATSLFESLERILSLPADTLVLPAHISHAVSFDGKMVQGHLTELKDRLELLNLSKEQFIEATLNRIPPAPPNYLTIADLNRKGSFEGQNPADLEAGANRCAVA